MACTLQLSGTLQSDRVSCPHVAWPVIVLLCLSAALAGCSSLDAARPPHAGTPAAPADD